MLLPRTASGHLQTYPVGPDNVCSSVGNGQSQMMSALLGAQLRTRAGTDNPKGSVVSRSCSLRMFVKLVLRSMGPDWRFVRPGRQ
jgi:hypothetical protein